MQFKCNASSAFPAIAAVSFMASAVAWSGGVAASGFALIAQSGSGLGNAYAGVASSAEDASTIFYNPAGMARLHGKQLVAGAQLVGISSQFSNAGSVAATGSALGYVPDSPGHLIVTPNLYFVKEISPELRIGTGLNAPFGSSTEYQPGWIGRFQALNSRIETVNVNPSISWQVNDAYSVGAGVNYQRIKGDLSNALNYAGVVYNSVLRVTASAPLAVAAAAGQGEGTSDVTGNDAAWGYNLGVLFNATPQTRMGLAYRSTVNYNLTGSVNFSANRPTAGGLALALAPLGVAAAPTAAAVANGIAAATANGPVSLAIKMPDNFSASVFHQVNDQWDIMADVNWTGWSVFDQIKVVRASGATLSLTQENWINTWRVALGASHHYNERWTARIGFAYDQSPVPDAYRSARLPDADRTWLSCGGQYKLDKGGVLDFGYAHLFIKKSTINKNSGGVDTASTALYAKLSGVYDIKADILSMQYTYKF